MLICRQHACDCQQPVMLGLELCRNVISFSGKPATKLGSKNIPNGSALTDCSTYALVLVINQIPWIQVQQEPIWDKHRPNYWKCYDGRNQINIIQTLSSLLTVDTKGYFD